MCVSTVEGTPDLLGLIEETERDNIFDIVQTWFGQYIEVLIYVSIKEVFDTYRSPFGEWKIDYYDCMYVKFDAEFVRFCGREWSSSMHTHLVNIIFSNSYSLERYIRRIIEHKYDVQTHDVDRYVHIIIQYLIKMFGIRIYNNIYVIL